MNLVDFILELKSRGISLVPRGEKLIVDAPAGALLPQDRVMLAQRKEQLLSLLTGLPRLDHLPPDWHQLWDERAAIMEYEGKLPRERAEFLALLEVRRMMKESGEKPCPTTF
jgi:hypothetical protein